MEEEDRGRKEGRQVGEEREWRNARRSNWMPLTPVSHVSHAASWPGIFSHRDATDDGSFCEIDAMDLDGWVCGTKCMHAFLPLCNFPRMTEPFLPVVSLPHRCSVGRSFLHYTHNTAINTAHNILAETTSAPTHTHTHSLTETQPAREGRDQGNKARQTRGMDASLMHPSMYVRTSICAMLIAGDGGRAVCELLPLLTTDSKMHCQAELDTKQHDGWMDGWSVSAMDGCDGCDGCASITHPLSSATLYVPAPSCAH